MKEISNVLKKAGTAAILALGIGVFAGAGSAYAAEGIDMSTDYPGITAKAGDSVSFALDFESLTGEGYDVDLSVESIPDGWSGSFTGADGKITQVHINDKTVDLETALVSFGVTIPENAETGTYTIELGADAGGDYTDTLSLQVTINEQENGQGSFSTSASSQEGSTGTSFSFDTTITNNHGSEQTYSLAATAPDGWQVSFTTDDTSQVATITVDAWGSQSVTIDITPPENVEVGEYSIPVTAYITPDENAMTGDYVTTLTVSNDEVSSDAEFRVSVKTRTVWGVIAVVIIIALIGGMGFIIKKYGRR